MLNDLVLEDEREAAFASFASLCDRAGLPPLDVREASASAERADGRRRQSTASLPDGSTLVFTGRPSWVGDCIEVDEEYELTDANGLSTVHAYTFTMRPWTREELRSSVEESGFTNVEIRPGLGRRTSDRLFVTAERG